MHRKLAAPASSAVAVAAPSTSASAASAHVEEVVLTKTRSQADKLLAEPVRANKRDILKRDATLFSLLAGEWTVDDVVSWPLSRCCVCERGRVSCWHPITSTDSHADVPHTIQAHLLRRVLVQPSSASPTAAVATVQCAAMCFEMAT